MTIVMVAHDVTRASVFSDRMVVLRDGVRRITVHWSRQALTNADSRSL
jgi:ABC-type nitrate/sulfonate/bicarbonate transport system ATPase subunit